MLDKRKVREVATKYSDEVRKIIDPVSVILFGSYVNGTPNEWSDIDVAVMVSNIKDEEWYDICTLLHKICWDKDKIADFVDIEPHLLNPNRDPSGFVEHVIKTGEVIYQAV